MDSLIINGDTSAILVGKKRELMQKIWMQLAAHKGSFPYNKELGSQLYQIATNDPKREQKTLQTIDEALKTLPQVTVEDVTFNKDAVIVWIRTEFGDDRIELTFEGRGPDGNI